MLDCFVPKIVPTVCLISSYRHHFCAAVELFCLTGLSLCRHTLRTSASSRHRSGWAALFEGGLWRISLSVAM